MTDAPSLTVSEELDALELRIANGIRWLTEHDPTGAFHLWFESKIPANGPMPAQSEERRAEYAAYCRQRRLFEDLMTRQDQLRRKEARLADEAQQQAPD